MATFRIVIQTEVQSAVQGTRQVKQGLDDVSAAATRLRTLIQQAFAFAGIGFGIKELINLSDTYTRLQNRIRLVIDANSTLESVTQQLFNISQRTRTSFDATATIFTRAASATKNLGVTQNELLTIVESINQAVAISGATSTESANALIQFSQGLASARLGGEELRSVLEQLPVIADVIVEHLNRVNPTLNVTRGSLRQLAAQGVVTPQVIIDSFREARTELADRFAKTMPTISQAFQRLHDQVLVTFGAFATGEGILNGVAQSIIYLADNLKTLTDIVLTLSIAYALRFVPAIIASTQAAIANTGAFIALAAGVRTWGAAVTLAQAATYGWTGALAVLKIAMLSLPLLAVAYVITRLITGTSEVAEAQARYNQVVADFQNSAQSIIKASGKTREKLIQDSQAKIQAMQQELLALNTLVEGYADSYAITVGFKEIFGRIGIGTAPSDVIAKSDKLRESIKQMQQILKEAINPPKGVNAPGTGGVDKRDTFEATIQKLREENAALGLNHQQRELVNKEIELEYRLKRSLTPAEKELYETLLAENQLLKDKADILDKLREPQENLQRGTAALTALYKEGKISINEYTDEMRRLQIESLQSGRDLESGIKRGLLTIQEQFGDVASLASDTLVNAFQKAEDALVEFVQTGKLNFKDLVSSILADLTRLSIRQNITAPLANFLGLGGGTGGGSSGLGGLLTSGLSSFFGSQGGFARLAQTGSSSFVGPLQQSSFFGNLGSFLGFATGGNFTVGGTGGTDSQLVSFKATPGEMVNISRPSIQPGNDNYANGQNNDRRPINVSFNISAPNPAAFRQSEGQMAASAARVIAKARRFS